jgi:pimeloyl-ACP methyl ester carboxylesterase
MTPTLVLHGDQDALTVPRFQQRLAQSLPNGESRTLDGIGHMLPWEAPVAFGQAVRHWLADR